MRKLLLIEDATELAQIIMRELHQQGYTIDHASNGESGLQLLTASTPDLVILDWMLPGISGLDVLREIRSHSAMPVLMLTARSEETDRVIGLELGADDYVVKPFGMRELVARVRALLRRLENVERILAADREPAPELLSYGSLTLYPLAMAATLEGAELILTRTEFSLATLLLRNPGRAFSRAYLLDAVWGQDFVASDRSVDNAILRLRRKLGSLGKAIETVWGVGYRLRSEVGS